MASVHTAAVSVRDWVRDYAFSLSLRDSELESLRRPNCKEAPYLNDLAFIALKRIIGDQRFVVAGDWNTCRHYRGGPEFFVRAKSSEWVECHEEPEEPSWFGKGSREYQLDHAFVDKWTAANSIRCEVHISDTVRALSDHAPMVVDVDGVEEA